METSIQIKFIHRISCKFKIHLDKPYIKCKNNNISSKIKEKWKCILQKECQCDELG
jgi:hypothetical protein